MAEQVEAVEAVGTGGPFVQLAVLCEHAQQDQYGSLSVLNVLEQLVAGSSDPKAPDVMPEFRFQADLVVAFASGTVSGDIIFQVPTGDHAAELTWQPNFFGAKAANVWLLGL